MKNQYSLSEFLSTSIAFVITKFLYKGARLIRRPFYIRGKKNLEFGKNLTTGHACRFDLSGNATTLKIGESCELGDNVHIVAHKYVEIGDNVLIASKVFISDTSHGEYRDNKFCEPSVPPNKRPLYSNPVIIGKNIWIGENAVILSGTTIGDGCIIGANAVITKDVPANSIVAGVPATIIKVWDSDKGWT